MEFFKVKTNMNNLKIFYDAKFIDKSLIKIDKPLFFKMCKEGCKNFGLKYSCPPFAPKFSELSKNKEGLFVIIFLLNLDEIKSTEYNKIRIANAVMKSRIDKLMRILESKFNTIFLSTGSCRLCKPCKLKLKLPCKYPNKKRYSLEATGIDCNKLSKDLFDIELLWYKNKKAPKYSSVMCGLVCDKKDEVKLKKELEKYNFN